ncbi:ABC transporter substrate-binding protein [Tianweitania sediminis]|uniref:ABC transporter substrate-binding protein n=1 Tax=Tianweitania sediminis TaxID=1502156 RepID=A0A8J7UGU0_9HYPH|nr:ABC transporter substrate-binding protein [Tianweitania sediminis]MBP0437088.1 ABC transporter substrate-binding protein [Tianweitania sediminis]
MLRRQFLSLAVSTSLLLAGVAGSASAQMAEAITEPVTISFYNYNLASAGIGREATLELIAKFEEANPNVKVEPIGAPSNEVLSRVQADMVAGLDVDVAQLVFRDLIYAAEELGAQPLEDVAGDELAKHALGFVPAGLALGEVDGKTYGLAYVFSTPVMFINRDLFKQAGLDPDQPPRTWEEVKTAGKAIAEKTGKHGFFPGAYGPTDGTFVYQSIVMSNGGGKVRDGNTLTFADKDQADAVAMLRDLMDSGAHARIDVGAHMDTFQSGNLGMFLYTSAILNRMESAAQGNFELGLAPMPSFGEKPTAPTNSGSAVFMFSQDPVKQRAAWELMKFLTSDEAYTIITSKIGYLPLRPGIVNDERYLKGWLEQNPKYRANLEQLDRLTPNVAFGGPNYRQVENMMKDAMTEAVFGSGDPRQVLKAAQEQAQPLMPAN